MKSLDEHLAEFKRDGFTLLPRMLDPAWIREMRDGFEELEGRIPNADGSRPSAITNLLEHKPEPVLRALSNERLLDFAEMLVGPHVQLESITFRRTPPEPENDGAALGFHRDMFAFFPEDGVYHRPLLFNALSYLQDLTDETGPLRIIPGSHMRALRMSPEEARRPHPEEVIVYPKAGDTAVFHCSMLHSGSPNRSGDYRYLFFLTFNHSWLKHRANYQGPVSQAVIAGARARNDRRLLRLLGVDDQFVQRANCGFLEPDEENWKRWIADDAAARNA